MKVIVVQVSQAMVPKSSEVCCSGGEVNLDVGVLRDEYVKPILLFSNSFDYYLFTFLIVKKARNKLHQNM